ncbi:unnamed protein product [Paramecium primaurelia]|nr:unnamed protein product [Paramecium primaurelia]
MELELKDLCKGLPSEFQRYLDYVYKLKFTSTPDYKYLLDLFQKIAKQNNISFDRKFDWMDNQTSSTKSSDQAQQSFNDIDISNLQSDYLKISDLKKSERRKSYQIDQNSQQSSVILNYAPSIVSKNNIRNFQRSRQNSKQSYSRESSLIKQPFESKFQGPLFQNREFRDFDDLENKEKINPINSIKFSDFDDLDDEMNDDLQIHQGVGIIKVHFKEHLSKQ